MTARILALLALAALFGTPNASAQACADHAVFQEGTVVSMAQLNPKGKQLGVNTTVTESTSPIDGGVRADIRATSTMKGAPKDEVKLSLTCSEGTISMDMRSFVPVGIEAQEGWEITFEGNDLAFPTALSAGQRLPDGKMVMNMSMPGMKDAPPGVPTGMRYELTIKDRQVVGKESVTTPAGTFDAWKITYDTFFEMQGAMPMTVKNESSEVQWYVPELGVMVKSETWRKGKLDGRTELAELKKG